jgi:hypothetical protein
MLVFYHIVRSLFFTATVSVGLLVILSLGAIGFVLFTVISLCYFVYYLAKVFRRYRYTKESDDK